MLIKSSKKYCKCSKTFGRGCSLKVSNSLLATLFFYKSTRAGFAKKRYKNKDKSYGQQILMRLLININSQGCRKHSKSGGAHVYSGALS